MVITANASLTLYALFALTPTVRYRDFFLPVAQGEAAKDAPAPPPTVRATLVSHTPANFHYGHAAEVAKERSAPLAAARVNYPERFNKTTDPRILALPGPAWINQPKEVTEESAA